LILFHNTELGLHLAAAAPPAKACSLISLLTKLAEISNLQLRPLSKAVHRFQLYLGVGAGTADQRASQRFSPPAVDDVESGVSGQTRPGDEAVARTEEEGKGK